jgi:hypothetical protein
MEYASVTLSVFCCSNLVETSEEGGYLLGR